MAPLRLSVIVPALNEQAVIEPTLRRLRPADVWEIIVVDGQSRDRTRKIARSLGARVVRSAPGRGRQLNAGAAAATGDTLLFLHADTLLPQGFQEHIAVTLATPGVVLGAFTFRLDASGRLFRIVERLVSWRCRLLALPYGDQGLFVRREAFRRLGGFPELKIMEDFAFVRRARRAGRVVVTRAPAVTSARRWTANGTVRTTLSNQVCALAFLAGCSTDQIARWRNAPPVGIV
ncbi:MAG: glycosyltransferase family 2 protein [bacterium]|nr:glycosyltransferase family 2 protein [bacterium]